MKKWKKGDRAFIIVEQIEDVVEIKLLEQCIDPDYFIISVVQPSKKFEKLNLATVDTLDSKFFFITKKKALQRYREIIEEKIKLEEDSLECHIKEKKAWIQKQKKNLQRISKGLNRE